MRTFLAFTVGLSVASVAARAQPGLDGYDFVTIGAVNNPAYNGPDPFDRVSGRGSVGYEYRIGRTEVTTAQWMEFINAASARADPPPGAQLGLYQRPIRWGATIDSTYTGPGVRYRLRTDIPDAGMLPVGGVGWRQAAALCNWLHNDKSLEASAFATGAYDVSTFGSIEPGTFTDQAQRSAGARYWIPNLDEWMKAVHFDANGNGGQGRWWEQPNGTDIPLTYEPPPSFGGSGAGQANAGFTLPNFGEAMIPLGSYPLAQTPWGLLDAAGATREFLEDIRIVDGEMTRYFDGSSWGGSTPTGPDSVWGVGDDWADVRSLASGFRVASVVPAPSSALVLMCLGGMCVRRSRRE